MKYLKKNWSFFILIFSIIIISIVLTAEYIFNILPCKMCLYQRYSYYGLILLSIIFILIKKQDRKIYLFLVEILIIAGLIFSLWHVGIENHLIDGPSGCASNINNINNIENLKIYILKRPIVACDEINWTFLGISFAVYNSITQAILLIINSRFIFTKND